MVEAPHPPKYGATEITEVHLLQPQHVPNTFTHTQSRVSIGNPTYRKPEMSLDLFQSLSEGGACPELKLATTPVRQRYETGHHECSFHISCSQPQCSGCNSNPAHGTPLPHYSSYLSHSTLTVRMMKFKSAIVDLQ